MLSTTVSGLQLFLVDSLPEANDPPKSLQAWEASQRPLLCPPLEDSFPSWTKSK